MSYRGYYFKAGTLLPLFQDVGLTEVMLREHTPPIEVYEDWVLQCCADLIAETIPKVFYEPRTTGGMFRKNAELTREIIEMKWDGVSLEEIALKMGVTKKHAKTILDRIEDGQDCSHRKAAWEIVHERLRGAGIYAERPPARSEPELPPPPELTSGIEVLELSTRTSNRIRRCTHEYRATILDLLTTILAGDLSCGAGGLLEVAAALHELRRSIPPAGTMKTLIELALKSPTLVKSYRRILGVENG